MAKIINTENLKNLLLELSGEFKVVAPVLKNPRSTTGQYVFEELKKDSQFVFGYPTTNLPPKEFFLPPEEVLFEYENGKIKDSAEEERKILFGLSIEDLEGVARLKDIFSRPIKDKVFEKRDKNIILIGLDRFNPPVGKLFDLYLMNLGKDQFAGFAGSKEGQKILKNPLFSEKRVKIPSVKKKGDELLKRKDLAKIVEGSRNHPVWKELAEICFGCGICSYVCPLCYCFETEDKTEIDKDKGARCRSWDSCMLYHFAETSAGNFRPELEKRIYNWYFHKFVRMPAEYGFSGCVGCNRCIIYCPAKINYRRVLERLVRDAK